MLFTTLDNLSSTVNVCTCALSLTHWPFFPWDLQLLIRPSKHESFVLKGAIELGGQDQKLRRNRKFIHHTTAPPNIKHGPTKKSHMCCSLLLCHQFSPCFRFPSGNRARATWPRAALRTYRPHRLSRSNAPSWCLPGAIFREAWGLPKAGSTGKWLEGCQIANMWTLIETRHDHLVYSCSCSSLLNSIVVELEILKVVPNLWLVLCVIPPFWFLFGATLISLESSKATGEDLVLCKECHFRPRPTRMNELGMYKPSSWMAFVDTGFPSKWKGNVLYIYIL